MAPHPNCYQPPFTKRRPHNPGSRPDLVQLGLNETLTTEARVDRHDENQIHLATMLVPSRETHRSASNQKKKTRCFPVWPTWNLLNFWMGFHVRLYIQQKNIHGCYETFEIHKKISRIGTPFFKANRSLLKLSWKLFVHPIPSGEAIRIPPLNPATLFGDKHPCFKPIQNRQTPRIFSRDLCQDVLNLRQWGAWIQDHTCHTSHRFDLVQGAMQMDGRSGLGFLARWV